MSLSLKMILSAVLLLGGGYLGSVAASALSVRVQQINDFINSITQLKFNIGYLNMPVARALKNVSQSGKGLPTEIFLCISDEMQSSGTSAQAAFEKAVIRYRGDICMKNSDMDILREFVCNLGKGGTEYETNNIDAAIAKLSVAEAEAKGEKEQRYKLWRGAGILLGAFAAIILF